MQFSTPMRLPVGRPGDIPEGVRPKAIRSYANAAGGTISSTEMSFQVTSPPAQPFSQSGDDADRIVITVRTTGACCLPDIVINYQFPDPLPATQADLMADILLALQDDTRLNGLGRFVLNGTTLTFTAYQPAIDVFFLVDAAPDRTTVTVTELQQSASLGQRVGPGLAVVYDPSASHAAANESTDNWEIAFLPTQDVNDPASTQKWAGISANCRDHEQPPVLSTAPFAFNNCNPSECDPPPSCIRALEEGPIYIELEQPFDFSAPCPELLYRYAPDGDFTQQGAFSLTAGNGLAEVPISYKIVKAYNGGSLLHLVVFGLK